MKEINKQHDPLQIMKNRQLCALGGPEDRRSRLSLALTNKSFRITMRHLHGVITINALLSHGLLHSSLYRSLCLARTHTD